MPAYMNFHCLFVSASSQACSWTVIVFREQGLVQYDILFFLPSVSSRWKFVLAQKKKKESKIPVCLISHLVDRLCVTRTVGFSHITGNLFPIVSSSVIKVYQKGSLPGGQSRRFYESRERCDFGRAIWWCKLREMLWKQRIPCRY